MTIVDSKGYHLILCRGIVTAAIVLTSFISSQMARATDGDLDPTFGTGGMVMTDLNRSTDLANAMAIQSDGKLVVVGQTYKHNDYSTKTLPSPATIRMARSTPPLVPGAE